ncbi:MAG: glycosyltransferase family 2 protein [Anaerolineales bacterium]|nr:glycosyltransferase family 2 protein [Anaerolineales bacterium]
MPTVSVIMAAYNAAPYLAAAVNSVLAQTERAWELIVVDDGSTDDTPAVLARYSDDPRFSVIAQANGGPAAARNRGLEAAQGTLIALLDADDVWRPGYLAAMRAALEADPQAVAAFAGWQYMDASGAPLPQVVIAQAEGLAEALSWRNPLVPSGAVIRRAALEQCGGFDPALRGVEDWDLWLRLAAVGGLVVVPQVLVFYRTHAENLSDQVDGMEANQRALLAKHLGPLPADPTAGTPLQRRALGALCFNAALGYFRRRQTEAARAKVGEALRAWPAWLDTPEFYYELACAYQPRGRRGRPDAGAWAEGAALVRRVVLEGRDPPAEETQRRAWWAQACLVLAQLAPEAGQARRQAAEAWRWADRRHKPAALRAWLRAALPAPIGDWARRLRRGHTPGA